MPPGSTTSRLTCKTLLYGSDLQREDEFLDFTEATYLHVEHTMVSMAVRYQSTVDVCIGTGDRLSRGGCNG